MTPENRTLLSTLTSRMVSIAARVGSLHGWWEDIGECQTALQKDVDDATAAKLITEAQRLLGQSAQKPA